MFMTGLDLCYDVMRSESSVAASLKHKGMKDTKYRDWCFSDNHLRHIFKVVVSFLQRPGSVKGFPHAGVFAEERFAVVLDPVYHLDEAKHTGHWNLHRGLKLIPAAASFFFFLQVSMTKRLRAHELKIKDETGMICRGNLGQCSVDDEDFLQ